MSLTQPMKVFIITLVLESFNLPTECIKRIEYDTLEKLFTAKVAIREQFYNNRIELSKEIEKRFREFYLSIDNDIDLTQYNFQKICDYISYILYSFTGIETNKPIAYEEIKEGIEEIKNKNKIKNL